MHKPVIPITLAYIAGLLLGHGFLYFPWSIIIFVILGLAASASFILFDKLTLRRSLLLAISGTIGMTAYLISAAWFTSDHYTRLAPDKKIHELTGTIASPLDRDPDRTGFILKLSQLDGATVTGKVRVSVREALKSVGYGDTVRVRGKLFEPGGFNNPRGFDYSAFLARSGIYSTVSVKNSEKLEVVRKGTGIFRTIQDWRERIRQAFLSSMSGPGCAILQAMVLGEEGGITDDMRDQFMAAGVTHIISISGSHLGMVAALCFFLIRWLLFLLPEERYHRLTLFADPKKIAAWLTLPLVIFYTLLAGGQVATVRSLVMISAGIIALIVDRENALMHSLALAALFLLIAHPQALFDISFQLSYLSVLVIGFVITLWNDIPVEGKTYFQRLRNNIILLTGISLATSLATGPIVAHYFNQVSFAGIISNMIVVPFAGMVVVPLGLFSGIVSLFTNVLPFSVLNQFLSSLFVEAVAFFSRFPFAEFHPPAPGLPWLLSSVSFLFLAAGYARSRLVARFNPLASSQRVSRWNTSGLALSGTILVLLTLPVFLSKQHTVVTFPDVGQGDSALIELPSGKNILIDGGGTRDNRFDMGRRVLAPCLWNKGVRRLDLVVLSHPHPDHMNGLIYILKKFYVAEVWDSGMDADLPGYDEFSAVIRDRKIRHRVVSADDPPVMLGDAMISVLHPRRGFEAHERQAYAAENNRSLVVRVRSEGRDLLFTGDIGIDAERDIMRMTPDLNVDLIKVPHHGSKTSSGDAWVSATKPELAVITVGKGNLYHHPSDEVLSRYEKIGARIFRTDLDGMIALRMNNSGFDVLTWNDLMLKRIDARALPDWGRQERINGKRLWLRAAAF